VLVALAVVVLDQSTKELALRLLEPGRFVPLVGSSVGWQLIFNPGAAFGLRLPPIIFPLVTVVLVIVVMRTLPYAGRIAAVAQGLVIGGAVGNVVDRITRPGDDVLVGGHVVDFVAWGTFPRFNLADAAITVGVVLFVLVTLLEERAERRRAVDGT